MMTVLRPMGWSADLRAMGARGSEPESSLLHNKRYRLDLDGAAFGVVGLRHRNVAAGEHGLLVQYGDVLDRRGLRAWRAFLREFSVCLRVEPRESPLAHCSDGFSEVVDDQVSRILLIE